MGGTTPKREGALEDLTAARSKTSTPEAAVIITRFVPHDEKEYSKIAFNSFG